MDTTYAAGAQVTYSFASRPGRAAPIVVLDDTLAPANGQIVMSRDRTFEVLSDTVFTYETLQPLEKTIADMERELLTGSDKAGTQEALVRFFDRPVFANGATLAGPLSASIRATSSNTSLELIAKLYDVAPDGRAVRISLGAVLGSQSARRNEVMD